MECDTTSIVPAKATKDELIALISEDKDIKKLLSVSFSETVISHYNSHFPKSQELQKLEKIHPGITGKLMEMMEKNQEHNIKIERGMLEEDRHQTRTINLDIIKSNNTHRLKATFSFVIVMSVLYMAYIMVGDKAYTPAISLVGVLATFMGAMSFMTGDKSKKNEEDGE